MQPKKVKGVTGRKSGQKAPGKELPGKKLSDAIEDLEGAIPEARAGLATGLARLRAALGEAR